MSSKSRLNSKKQNPIQNNKSQIIGFVVFVLCLWLVVDLIGFGGNIRFYSKWIACGQKPLMSGVTYVGRVPHYHVSPNFKLFRSYPQYFCAPLEAERKGYSADPENYDFPHLRAIGEKSPLSNQINEDMKRFREYQETEGR